jgi:integrase
MKANETQSGNATSANVELLGVRKHGSGQYQKVFDARKRRLRGLWERNGAFYGQLTIADPNTGAKAVRRVRLEDKDGNPVATVPQAVAVMGKLKSQRGDDGLKITLKRTPTLSDYGKTYIARLEQLSSAAGNAKRPGTIRLEKTLLRSLDATLGERRLREITPGMFHDHIAGRIKAGVSARYANLERNTLRNVLKSAIEDKIITTLPTFKRLKEIKTARRCLTTAEIEAVANAAKSAPMTGQMVHNFILLMAFSGGRWAETLRLRWQDVDFDQKQLHYGMDGLSKNGERRAVDFNNRLEKHLRDMVKRRAPDNDYLFPSPQRNEHKNFHAITFNTTIRDARVAAGVKDFTCHLCRHYFASMALMSKVDVHTVASWLGHKDNGVLLAKTYSHLLNEHKREQVQRVNF